MGRVFGAHAVSVDGFITGRDPALQLRGVAAAPGVTHLHHDVLR